MRAHCNYPHHSFLPWRAEIYNLVFTEDSNHHFLQCIRLQHRSIIMRAMKRESCCFHYLILRNNFTINIGTRALLKPLRPDKYGFLNPKDFFTFTPSLYVRHRSDAFLRLNAFLSFLILYKGSDRLNPLNPALYNLYHK